MTADAFLGTDPNSIEQFYKTLIESVDDIVFVVDSNGRYQMANERGFGHLGLSPAELIGKTPREVFGDTIGDKFERGSAAVIAGGVSVTREEWYTIAGKARCYSTILSPIIDNSKKVTAIVGICRDVTELKRMSEELETYAEEMGRIVEQRVRYERFLTALTQEAIKRQPLVGFLDTVVARLGELLGVSRSYFFEYDIHHRQVSNTHEWAASGITPLKDFGQDIKVDTQPWVTKELFAGQIIRLENAESATSPELRTLLAVHDVKSTLMVPIFAFGNPYGFIGFDECLLHRHWEDIDAELLQSIGRIIATTVERRRLESEVLRIERLAATGRLAASLAHEINNPLQGVMLHLEAIRLHVDKKYKRNFDFVVEGMQRVTSIIAKLLALHKSAKRTVEIDLNEVVKEAFQLVANQFAVRGCDVRWRLDANIPRVHGDSEQLHQVFLNIILNSSDNMDAGGAVTITSGFDGKFVSVEIEDAGMGIDEESIPYLFEPFFSTKERSGTGLGLFISHAVVVDHGGRIDVSSKKGKGTSMRVLLPVSGRVGAVQKS